MNHFYSKVPLPVNLARGNGWCLVFTKFEDCYGSSQNSAHTEKKLLQLPLLYKFYDVLLQYRSVFCLQIKATRSHLHGKRWRMEIKVCHIACMVYNTHLGTCVWFLKNPHAHCMARKSCSTAAPSHHPLHTFPKNLNSSWFITHINVMHQLSKQQEHLWNLFFSYMISLDNDINSEITR
jgi:hypothetical protein